MSVGNRISKILDDKNISQKYLSEKTDISRSVLNRIILGTRPIRDDEIIKLANVLDVSTDYLLGNPINDNEVKQPNYDIKEILKTQSMTYNGEEISEHDLTVLQGIVDSLLGGGGDDK